MSKPVEIKGEPTTPIDKYMQLRDDYTRNLLHCIPNALTLGNLACGLSSLIMAIHHLHRSSALFIFLAFACDFFDGRVARMLGITTDLGAQLDSLADVVSFGVAPTILAHSIQSWSILMVIAFFSFPLAGAWRLARFNVYPTHEHFIGLPIPVAGLTVAFLALFLYVSPVIMIGLALLMVSRIQIPKP